MTDESFFQSNYCDVVSKWKRSTGTICTIYKAYKKWKKEKSVNFGRDRIVDELQQEPCIQFIFHN